jgi:hypothetical protein
LGFLEIGQIFLWRTAIALPIVALTGHMLF